MHVGITINVRFTVKNIDNSTAAGRSHTGIYISPNANISSGKRISEVSLEALQPNATSDVQFNYPVPYDAVGGDGTYYVIVKLNDENEISESRYDNNSANTSINANHAPWAAQNIPYPIILVHGYNSKNTTWNNLIASFQNSYGWSYGGNMNFCLNYDADVSHSDKNTDYHDFTDVSSLRADDYYTVNFDVNYDGTPYSNSIINESNQSAVVKQGLAIRDAIKHVLAITGKDKVILVCHSMGGLAAREYLQNTSLFQSSDSKKHVAKLVTLGTPHGGTNVTDFGVDLSIGADFQSEAIRDLRTSYFYSYYYPSPDPNPSIDAPGTYLFGGIEDLDYMRDQLCCKFHNTDVNCDGDVAGQPFAGLNHESIPTDLTYSCIMGTGDLLGGDGIVTTQSANINNYRSVNATTFTLPKTSGIVWHTELTKQFAGIMQGMDEPSNDFFSGHAYSIASGQLYYGNITYQSVTSLSTDDDSYMMNVSSTGSLNIQVYNIQTSVFSIEVFNSSKTSVYSIASNGKSYLNADIPVTSGNYYIVLSGIPTTDSYKYPYAFKCSFSNNTCTAPTITSHPSPQAVTSPNGTSFSISATGSSNSYQWQYNVGNGWLNVTNASPYSGASSTTLNLSSTAANMNSNQYRCFVTSACTSKTATSNPATLTVNTSSASCNNDNACTPKTLNLTSSCVATSCSTIGATNQSIPFYGGANCSTLYNANRTDDDVWFSITPTSNNPVTITVSPTSNLSNFDPSVGLYTGDCSSPTQISCATATGYGQTETLIFTPTLGTTYLIRVFSYDVGSTYSGNFNICATQSATSLPNLTKYQDAYSVSNNAATFNITVQNNGAASSTPTNIAYYLSTSPTFTTWDYLLGTSVLPALNAGSTYNANPTFNLCDVGIPNGTYYVVYFIDNAATVTESNENDNIWQWASDPLTINCCVNPSTPTASDPTGIAQNSFVAHWTAVSNETGYYVDVATNPSFTNPLYTNLAVGNVTSPTIPGLACGTTYYYRVRAGVLCSFSDYSNIVTAQTSTCCTAPVAPASSIPNGVSYTAFEAAWNTVTDATSYYLDVATNSTFTNFVSGYNNLNVGNINYSNVHGLTCGTNYFYRVRASNSCSTSLSSGTITASTLPCCPAISAPTVTYGSDVCPGIALTGTQTANLSFVSNGGLSFNGLAWKYPYNDAIISTECFTSSPLQIPNLVKGMLYRWALNAYSVSNCASCQSSVSNSKYFHIPPEITVGNQVPSSSVSMCDGSVITLSTITQSPGSGATVNYKWFLNGKFYNQGNNLTSIQASSAGTYTLQIEYSGSTLCTGTVVTNPSNSISLVISNQNSWIGTTNNSWHNPANWSCGIVPNENIDVIINAGTPFICTINSPAVCRTLNLGNGAKLNNNNNLIIKH